MSEEELKSLCESKNVFKGRAVWLYWPSELYSFGKYIRKYGYYPSFLPLAVYSDHSGPTFSDIPYLHEKETNAEFFLAHRKEKVIKYKEITGKKAYTLYSPSVFYRRYNLIKQDENASGTICFPEHSLLSEHSNFNIKKYCDDLKMLPIEFHPIKLCLHMHDVNNDTFKQYMENGFEVLSAGNTSDYRFVERLYDIIKKAKFISSNSVGTITLLSIEMRIPFFIYGNKQSSINISNKNLPKGIIKEPDHKQFKYLKNKLSISEDFKVSKYNKKIIFEAESALGLYDGISRKKMFIVLYLALLLWIIKFKWIYFLKSKLK